MKLWEVSGPAFEKHPKAVAILPVGSIERHGNHLPLGTDTMVVMYLAERLRERLDVLVLPPIWYGSCRGLKDFPGTFDIEPNVLYNYVLNVMVEAARNGIHMLVTLNGHGGNTEILGVAAREAAFRTEMHVILLNWWSDLGIQAQKELFEAPGHAGEDETSVMLAIAPDTVKMSRAMDHVVTYPSMKIYSKKVERLIYPDALSGSATKASPEKGKSWLDTALDDLVRIIREAAKLLGINV